MFHQSVDVIELKKCLACNSENLIPVLDLNDQPLANSYKKTKEETEKYFPLAINRCDTCFHVQLTHAVNPDLMFKNYLYVSGTSITMQEHFKWFANYSYEYYKLITATKPTRVLDIGCNDGSQLNQYRELGMNTSGIDPALNLYDTSSKKHLVFPVYFDSKFIEKNITEYDIIVAQNVFAHNFSPIEFLINAKKIMDNDSLLFIQTSQADMIKNNEFDTIYHEHISFYNIKSMQALVKRAGLFLIDVTKCPLHGNSYIFVISRNSLVDRPSNISNLITMEKKLGLYSPETYEKYAKKCNGIVSELKAVVEEYTSEHNRLVVGYGAAAKGMTLLNYAKIPMAYIVDDNPLKQGLFTPGRNIPIVDSSKLVIDNDKPMLFIPLAWNFFEEIKNKIKRSRDNKDDLFCTYFPEVLVQL